MNETNLSTNAARKLLREIGEMSEHASLTRSLQGGAARVAERYNAVLRQFQSSGHVPLNLFAELDPATTNYGELGVEARMLMAFLSDDKAESSSDFGPVVALAPFLNSADLAAMVHERMDQGVTLADEMLPALAPFLDSDTLGQLVRRRAGFKASGSSRPAPDPAEEEPAVAHAHPSSAIVPADSSESLESLAARLRDPGLQPEERSRIAMRLAQIAHDEATQALE